MSIWNKVLIGLICVASLAFFYLAARTLKTHQHWRELAQRHQVKIKEYQAKSEQLINGKQGEPGIRQLQVELDGLLVDRGRVWRDVRVVKTNKDTGETVVGAAADPANPNSLLDMKNVVLYAFDGADAKEKGQYLGEFRVSASDEKQTTLTPTNQLTSGEIGRLAAAKDRPWVLYEELPRDSHAAFAGLSDDDKKVILPAATVSEYLKDGQPAAAEDPQDRVVDGKYVRPLRDYRVLFNADRVNWTEMRDLVNATQRDKAMIDSALADAKKQEQISQQLVAEAKKRLERFAREREIVAAHHKALEDKVAEVTAAAAKLIETNKAKAVLIARNQWDAVRRIDQRARSVVQSGAGETSCVGVYDRDYYRGQRPGVSVRAPQTVVGWLIAINVAVWLISGLFTQDALCDRMAVQPDAITHPLLWWQFVSYAFAHAPGLNHILSNMFVLFMLGRDVEAAYGRREFLRVYLVTAVFAALVWTGLNEARGVHNAIALGASGAISGIVVLYALNFPHRMMLLFFVIPVPAWVLGVLVVAYDIYGAVARSGEDNVAYVMHIAGAAFAFVYYQQQWNLTRLTKGFPPQWLRSWNRPKLHVHQPSEEPEPETPHVDLNEEVDRILEKIYREGEASLTAKERRTLETASHELQRKGRVGGGKGKP